MTSMKTIRTHILSKHSVNMDSNMLHLRVKIRFYFSVSVKPLGEIKKKISFPIYICQKLFTCSWAGQGWAAGRGTQQSSAAWKQSGLTLKLFPIVGPAASASENSIYYGGGSKNQEKAMQVSGNLSPSARKMLRQIKFHSVRKTEGFKASVTMTILWEIIFPYSQDKIIVFTVLSLDSENPWCLWRQTFACNWVCKKGRSLFLPRLSWPHGWAQATPQLPGKQERPQRALSSRLRKLCSWHLQRFWCWQGGCLQSIWHRCHDPSEEPWWSVQQPPDGSWLRPRNNLSLAGFALMSWQGAL